MDVGIKPADMPIIARGTKFIAGYDQPGKKGGDSGPTTALGVFVGLKAAVKHRFGVETTKGLTVAIQGLGKVGMGVAKRLHEESAKLIVSDVNDDLVRRAAADLGHHDHDLDLAGLLGLNLRLRRVGFRACCSFRGFRHWRILCWCRGSAGRLVLPIRGRSCRALLSAKPRSSRG